MSDTVLSFGVNADTGEPLLPDLAVEELAQAILQEKKGIPSQRHTLLLNLQQTFSTQVMGVRAGFDEEKVEQVGWGIIYHPDTPLAVRQILQKLADHRQSSWEPFIYQPDEFADDFQIRHDQDPGGEVDPQKLPYYLLIVAAPNQIPFEFQFDLDKQHAIGRLYFENVPQGGYDLAAYGQYVDRLIAYETASTVARGKQMAVFSPTHQNDPLIDQTTTFLAKPLHDKFHQQPLVVAPSLVYTSEHCSGNAGTTAALLDLLTRSTNSPSFLFTSSHGIAFNNGSVLQRRQQGALLCGEWPGAQAWPAGKTIPSNMYFSGENVPADADLSGLVVFSFACFSAGTPQTEAFAQYFDRLPQQLAPANFTAYLPQRLLAQGALAFLGHVERTWSFSYAWADAKNDNHFWIDTFEDTIADLLSGKRVGSSMQRFNQRYLNLNAVLTSKNGLIDRFARAKPVSREVAKLWTARNDARGYVLVGDPAVRLRPEAMG